MRHQLNSPHFSASHFSASHCNVAPARTLVRACLAAAGLHVAVACADDAPTPKPPDSGYALPSRVGALRFDAMTECSGLAASRRSPGFFWAHNDSGDSARLFAIDRAGELVAELLVDGAENDDWEDVAVGPGPKSEEDCVYIADTGNNSRGKAVVTLYRLPEPSLLGIPHGRRWKSRPAEAFPFRFEKGPIDCEALAVHPTTGTVYLAGKSFGSFGVYRLDLAGAAGAKPAVRTAERIATLTLPDLVTAADISPDGTRLLLRSYLGLLEYRAPDAARFEEALAAKPVVIVAPKERQCEAACYTVEGDILTVSEGARATIFELERRAPKKAGADEEKPPAGE